MDLIQIQATLNTLYPEFKLDITNTVLEKIHKKYITKYHRFLCRKVIKNGGYFPVINKTKMASEFLTRGFEHFQQADVDPLNQFYIKSTYLDLVWPKGYHTQLEALEVMGRVGIPGFTGVKFPKNHK